MSDVSNNVNDFLNNQFKNHDFLPQKLLIEDMDSFFLKFFKDENNFWKKYRAYEIEDKFPLGHGEKSVIIANNFIKLTKIN